MAAIGQMLSLQRRSLNQSNYLVYLKCGYNVVRCNNRGAITRIRFQVSYRAFISSTISDFRIREDVVLT